MTTLQTQPSSYLQSTLLEDQMELSPGPAEGDDIDIDLDLDAAPPNDQENDYIIEDARPENIAERIGPSIEAGNDDVMHDGDHTFTDAQEQDVEFPDGEPYDTHGQILADDLSTQQRHTSEYTHDAAILGENGALYSPRLGTPEDLATTTSEHQEINFAEERTYNSGDSKNLTTEREAPTSSAQEVEATPVAAQTLALSEHNSLEPNQEDHNHDHAVPSDEHSVPSVPATSSNGNEEDDDALTDTYEEEEPNELKDSPSGVTHIHPVVVIYEGSEISLFPPFKDDTSDTFFLPDESLARANIRDLFEAIRSVLAGSISEDDELDMTVESLGLELSEDSIHARTTTLSQIVDLHVQLFHQDGVDEPDPLYMTLTTKVRFSKRFNEISSAAADGKGISQLPFWHGGGQDYGDYPTENTSHSEDIDHHPGWEADYTSHQDSQSPTKDLENPDTIGSRSTGGHAALPPMATDRKDPQELSGASIPRALSDGAESTKANNDEAHEVQRSSATIAAESLPEGGHSHDEAVVDTDHQEAVRETTSYPAEDELRDDDLIDYDDDDDDDGAGQYTSTGSSTLQSDDRRTSNEAEYAALNAAASRRSPAIKLSHGNLNDSPRGGTHSENEQEGDFTRSGVSGYEEGYQQYNDEDNDDGSQQYGGEAEHTQSEVYEDPEQYTENTNLNEYVGYQETTENEYTINDPEDWNSNVWHPEEQEIIGDNREEYYQQENAHGDGSEGEHPEESRYVLEHTNLDLHFDEEVEERPVHDSQINDPGQANGSRHTSGISAPIDNSGEQYSGETEKSTGVGEDEALYDDDDVFSDTFYGRDESIRTPDGRQATSLAHHDSTKRTLDEAEDGSTLEGYSQGSKRMRSR